MGKGESTRQAVLTRAAELARTVGLEGLTIGKLADELSLSKSGLFAHFRSKENLQLEVIDEARRQFVDQVVSPALRAPRGEPRVRALVERWMRWGRQEGGCFFIAASTELDDREGPVREAAVAASRDWMATLAQAVQAAVDEGHFRADVDVQQTVFELESIFLGTHFMGRFVRDPESERRAERAIEALLLRSKN
jgi:AcrR family transcriptional regulator